MTRLTVGTVNTSTANVMSSLTVANTSLLSYTTNQLTFGGPTVNSSAINVGQVNITPSSISTPTFVLGGTSYAGGLQGGVINYQEFTANGTWYNPLNYFTDTYSKSYSAGLDYTWYNTTITFAATNDSRLDLYFSTNTTGTTLGGTGTHTDVINWADVSTTGAGGLTGTKPDYLPANSFSWMVEGYILAPETGTYTFGVDSDDGADVYVDNQRVAQFYGDHGFAQVWSGNTTFPQQSTGTIDLTANTYYAFRARMQGGIGGDGIQVGWRKPSDLSIAIIPANAFYKATITQDNGGLTGNEQVLIMAWGAGGGAGGGTTTRTGGGGGGCTISTLQLSDLANTCLVTVGVGGVGTNAGTGASGGSTTFVVNSSVTVTAYGGAGGAQGAGGGGGGTLAAGSSSAGGAPLGGAAGASVGGASTFGGGGGTSGTGSSTGGLSIFGGGGGGQQNGLGGISIYGAAGGAGQTWATTDVATSIFGGSGGGGTQASPIAPTAPGGGGRSLNPTTTASDGARGEVRVWVIGRSSTTAGAPTYSIDPSVANVVSGGEHNFIVSTTNFSDGEILYYTLNNSSVAVSSDFVLSNGSVTIIDNQGLAIVKSNSTIETSKTFTVDLRTESTTGTIVDSSPTAAIKPRPFIVGSTSNTRSGGITTLTLTQPTYQTGDYGLLFIQCGDSRTFSSASQAGWSVLRDAGNTNRNMFVLSKTLSAAESATALTITVSSSTSELAGVMVAVRNANSSSVVLGPDTKVDGSPIALGGLTTTKVNSLIILQNSQARGSATINAPAGYSLVNSAIMSLVQNYVYSKYLVDPGLSLIHI